MESQPLHFLFIDGFHVHIYSVTCHVVLRNVTWYASQVYILNNPVFLVLYVIGLIFGIKLESNLLSLESNPEKKK